jgi:single-stranded DNA-binding protein
MFAMDHEDGTFVSGDTFLKQGMKIMREERERQREWEAEHAEHTAEMEVEHEVSHDISLLEGKVKREELKEELFMYLNNVE